MAGLVRPVLRLPSYKSDDGPPTCLAIDASRGNLPEYRAFAGFKRLFEGTHPDYYLVMYS